MTTLSQSPLLVIHECYCCLSVLFFYRYYFRTVYHHHSRMVQTHFDCIPIPLPLHTTCIPSNQIEKSPNCGCSFCHSCYSMMNRPMPVIFEDCMYPVEDQCSCWAHQQWWHRIHWACREVPSTRKYMYTNTKTDTHTNTLKKIRFGMNNNGAPNAKQIY
jgi:hypothetical protein